jgi:hypothetical protein
VAQGVQTTASAALHGVQAMLAVGVACFILEGGNRLMLKSTQQSQKLAYMCTDLAAARVKPDKDVRRIADMIFMGMGKVVFTMRGLL